MVSSGCTLEKMISAREAAEIMNCNVRTLKNKASRGEIPAMQVGNRWMFLPSLLDKWRKEKLMSNCSNPQNTEEQYGR